MSNWNPYPQFTPRTVDDGITEESDYLLVSFDGEIAIAKMYRCSPMEGDTDEFEWKLWGRDGYMANNVEAWMPLPDAYQK